MQSHLRIESFEFDLPSFWGTPATHRSTYWRVWIDTRLIAKFASPFTAADESITIFQCEECGQCGLPSILVRAHCGEVYWLDNAKYPLGDRTNTLGRHGFRTFDPRHYEAALTSGRAAELPVLSTRDLDGYFDRLAIPNRDDVLYVIPEIAGDPAARRLFHDVESTLRGHNSEFTLTLQPKEPFTVRIGIDEPGFPEALWIIGRIADRIAVRFDAFPDFPFWITSSELSRALESIMACCELARGDDHLNKTK